MPSFFGQKLRVNQIRRFRHNSYDFARTPFSPCYLSCLIRRCPLPPHDVHFTKVTTKSLVRKGRSSVTLRHARCTNSDASSHLCVPRSPTVREPQPCDACGLSMQIPPPAALGRRVDCAGWPRTQRRPMQLLSCRSERAEWLVFPQESPTAWTEEPKQTRSNRIAARVTEVGSATLGRCGSTSVSNCRVRMTSCLAVTSN